MTTVDEPPRSRDGSEFALLDSMRRPSSTASIDRRGCQRVAINVPVEFTVRDSWETASGIGKDISLGGTFIETEAPAPFGASVLVSIRLPSYREEMLLPGIVRWTKEDGMGVQFRLLGARDTRAITEMMRTSAWSSSERRA
jgi:Tfp pilus assembly protein PilZ